mmetsp:Transcript_4515/g.11607  ORF Transcript_4515/g.11607 Transcript_4515/m.11607 type:complete len:212 (+) Transcript_4515:494-1129(+)
MACIVALNTTASRLSTASRSVVSRPFASPSSANLWACIVFASSTAPMICVAPTCPTRSPTSRYRGTASSMARLASSSCPVKEHSFATSVSMPASSRLSPVSRNTARASRAMLSASLLSPCATCTWTSDCMAAAASLRAPACSSCATPCLATRSASSVRCWARSASTTTSRAACSSRRLWSFRKMSSAMPPALCALVGCSFLTWAFAMLKSV